MQFRPARPGPGTGGRTPRGMPSRGRARSARGRAAGARPGAAGGSCGGPPFSLSPSFSFFPHSFSLALVLSLSLSITKELNLNRRNAGSNVAPTMLGHRAPSLSLAPSLAPSLPLLSLSLSKSLSRSHPKSPEGLDPSHRASRRRRVAPKHSPPLPLPGF